MIPTELRHEFIKKERKLNETPIYQCKHCNRPTAHPELENKFPSICSAKDRRKETRRTIDKLNDHVGFYYGKS